eukprot:scaffold106_cov246-Pinguiococcus_pyrenoidosus.AAC.6
MLRSPPCLRLCEAQTYVAHRCHSLRRGAAGRSNEGMHIVALHQLHHGVARARRRALRGEVR